MNYKPSLWAADVSGARRPCNVKVRGVTDVESGYSNGPSHPAQLRGRVHRPHRCNEVVKLTFDPARSHCVKLLEIFFVIHDPTSLNRQGNDAGTQYRSGNLLRHDRAKAACDDMIRK